MYVLKEAEVILLDICDNMDIKGDKPPTSGVFLELLGYLNCDHLVYSHRLNDVINNEDILNYFR